jgi:hypothetical protein
MAKVFQNDFDFEGVVGLLLDYDMHVLFVSEGPKPVLGLVRRPILVRVRTQNLDGSALMRSQSGVARHT